MNIKTSEFKDSSIFNGLGLKILSDDEAKHLARLDGLILAEGNSRIEAFIHFIKNIYKKNLKFVNFSIKKIFISLDSFNDIEYIAITDQNSIAIEDLLPENWPSYWLEWIKSINTQLLSLANDDFETNKKDFIDIQNFENKNLTDCKNFIGNGGFGEIFVNKLENESVAIKFSKKNSSKKTFFKEFKIQSRLCHENIVKTYGFTKNNEAIGIVFEYCSNGSLREYLKTHDLAWNAKLHILLQISKAIEYMHIENICHNDIKPNNILLNAELKPKLADFGLSRYVKSGKNKTTGCTLNYSSPEHLNGDFLTKKSDVWSFGMTCYCVLTGKKPFDDLYETHIDQSCLYDKIRFEGCRPSFSKEFYKEHYCIVELLQKMWDFEPENRPTMKIVRQKLSGFLKN